MTRKIPLTQGQHALVDDADYERVSQHKWHIKRYSGGLAYATGRPNGGERKVLMHRFILNPPDGFEVDHINGDGLDNRRANLRVCSHAENQKNVKKPTTNTSGYKGVAWSKHHLRWKAEIRANGKRIHLGTFDTAEEAAAAYDTAAKQMHGEFARTNGSIVTTTIEAIRSMLTGNHGKRRPYRFKNHR